MTAGASPTREQDLSPPSGPRGYEMHHRVTFGETSGVGFVYFHHLLRWQGECREQFGYDHCPDYMSGLSGDLTMLTSSASCEYLGEIWPGDAVTIRLTIPWVRLHFMKGDFAYYRTTGASSELVGRGEQMWANAHRTGSVFRPAPWPQEVIDACVRFGTDISRALM
ncbi:acyl-CoA thioesterase [Streptomyces sp. NPDC006733]|uniref:acyl-CoA thioesterase n=1 Tax=Streptomyces sp. NPDC006733 TaxID=3155460 RepID=UPI0033E20DEC